MSVAPSSATARLSPAPEEHRALRRAWRLVRPHRGVLAGAALVSLVATIVELAVPVVSERPPRWRRLWPPPSSAWR